MAPFEALYGRKCRTLLNWSEPGERWYYGVDLVQEVEEKVKQIQKNLRMAQSRQKSYANKRRRPLEFAEGDYVYLKVSAMKGVTRFRVKGKLAPLYIGPFQIVKRCGKVAYQLKLPEQLLAVHNVFHVSQLKKCLRVPTETIDLRILDLQPGLTYDEQPIGILDGIERESKRGKIKYVKVQWSNHSDDEATWEHEDDMRKEYPELLLNE